MVDRITPSAAKNSGSPPDEVSKLDQELLQTALDNFVQQVVFVSFDRTRQQIKEEFNEFDD